MASFKYAFIGMRRLLGEAHARFHLCAAVVVIAAGVFFGIAPWEWVAVSLCIGGVLGAEALNTAIEVLADRITRQKDPMIGAAKDLGAAAVLFFAIASVVVGLIIFLPKIIALVE